MDRIPKSIGERSSDRGGSQVVDGASKELFHGDHDATDVGALVEHSLSGLFDGIMLAISVVVGASDDRQHREVGVGHLVTTDVSAAVVPMRIALPDEFSKESDSGLLHLLGGIIIVEGVALRLFHDIDNGGVEPFDFMLLDRVFGHIALLAGEHLQNSVALDKVLAVIENVDGRLCALTIGASDLDRVPIELARVLIKYDYLVIPYLAFNACQVCFI